jgi:hypothetical protein
VSSPFAGISVNFRDFLDNLLKKRIIEKTVRLWAASAMRGRGTLAILIMSVGAVRVTAADSSVGSIKTVNGAATVKRGADSIPAREGLHLLSKDTVETSNGRLGLILNDGTRVSIGPNTTISVDQFTFEPARGQLSLLLRMLRGVMVYVSGKIAELSPQSVRIETPVGILGLRGTQVAIALEQP